MKMRIHSKGSDRIQGLKIKKLGLRSIAAIIAGASVAGIGAKILSNVQGDTSAVSDDMLSISDMITINPVWEQYIADVEVGKGSEWDIIPNKYITTEAGGSRSYRSSNSLGNTNLPSSYNLITEGYGTKIKNQGTDGICWAYAITSVVESYLLKNNSINIELSPKQMDYIYASGTPNNDYMVSIYGTDGIRPLGDGYRLNYAMVGLSSNSTPVNEADFFELLQANDTELARFESWDQYNDIRSIDNNLFGSASSYTKEMPYDKVAENKSEYIITDVVDYYIPSSDNASDVVSKVKQGIYEKGAAFVGTVAPGTNNCYDKDTKTIIDRGSAICGNDGHAMTIVGWDDNYSYTDPSDGSTKTGAFILQNSWGKSDLFSRYGVSYDTLVEKGLIDPSKYTEAQIQSLKDFINNYDSIETLYLAYQFTPSSSITDFGLFENIEANNYDVIYDVTSSHNYSGSTIGSQNNEVIYTYSTGTDTNYIDKIAVSSPLVPFKYDLNYEISIDTGSDFIKVGDIEISKGTFAQRTIEISQPVEVSGTFKVKFALSRADNGQQVDIGSEYTKFFTMAAFAKNIDGSDPAPTPEPNGTVTWVQGENYEVGSGEDLILKADYPLELLTAVALDNTDLPEGSYKTESGSTILTIYSAFLDTLDAGDHTISLAYSNGHIVSASFTISEEEIPVPNTSADGDEQATSETTTRASSPETGMNTKVDERNSLGYTYVLPITAVVLGIAWYGLNRTKKHVNFSKR